MQRAIPTMQRAYTQPFRAISQNAVTTLNLTATMTSPTSCPKMRTRTILTSTMRKWRDMKPMRALSMRLTSG
nr:MAG TPA: hypothetical protein [Caudoviricetes sp.]